MGLQVVIESGLCSQRRRIFRGRRCWKALAASTELVLECAEGSRKSGGGERYRGSVPQFVEGADLMLFKMDSMVDGFVIWTKIW